MLREAVRDRWGKHPAAIQCEQEAALGAAYLAAANLDLIDQSWLLDKRAQDVSDIANATALIGGRNYYCPHRPLGAFRYAHARKTATEAKSCARL